MDEAERPTSQREAPRPSWARRRRRGLILAAIIAVSLALVSCAGYRVVPPDALVSPVRIYVIDYGKHASLVLPGGPMGLVEFSWGDWNYFALGNKGLGAGLEALFASQGSTMLRRDFPPIHDAAGWFADGRAERVLTLEVDADPAMRLYESLAERHRAGLETALTHPDGSVFVKDPAPYGMFNNSNHELARWLRQMGCRVSGYTIWAKFSVDPPGKVIDPPGR